MARTWTGSTSPLPWVRLNRSYSPSTSTKNAMDGSHRRERVKPPCECALTPASSEITHLSAQLRQARSWLGSMGIREADVEEKGHKDGVVGTVFSCNYISNFHSCSKEQWQCLTIIYEVELSVSLSSKSQHSHKKANVLRRVKKFIRSTGPSRRLVSQDSTIHYSSANCKDPLLLSIMF